MVHEPYNRKMSYVHKNVKQTHGLVLGTMWASRRALTYNRVLIDNIKYLRNIGYPRGVYHTICQKLVHKCDFCALYWQTEASSVSRQHWLRAHILSLHGWKNDEGYLLRRTADQEVIKTPFETKKTTKPASLLCPRWKRSDFYPSMEKHSDFYEECWIHTYKH